MSATTRRRFIGYAALLTAVLGEAEVITPASMGIADMRIVAAIGESIRGGAAVKIES